jgi:Cu/Ag efflux protein CusF
MKPMLSRLSTLFCVTMLSVVATSPLLGDASPTASDSQEKVKEKVFKGTVTAVNAVEKTVAIKGVWSSKTFNASDVCKVSLEDKPEAVLSDLRPGHKVQVHYQNAQGVLVAGQFTQHNQVLKGHITAIDPGKRTFVVKGSAGTRNFTVAENCNVILQDEKIGTLENLKVGHTVSVAYEEPTGKTWTAHKIEQKAETFVGTIQAIDASARTVKARSFMAEKKFNLGDGCRIVVEGRPDASLRDLRIGDRVAFTYEDANGVLVANRIGLDSSLPETGSAQASRTVVPAQ